MSTDDSLIADYVRNGSEPAFTELVHRYLGLVHSAALRQVEGDTHKAEDVTQAVFSELARKAPDLLSRRCLAGWLYNTARFIASRVRRSEMRRIARERTISPMIEEPIAEPANELIWAELRPVLDEAMQELNERDREAVILRFFQSKPLAEIGNLLRLSENSARMRVERALEKLRIHLIRRGIKSSAPVLAATIAAHVVATAPPTLAVAVIGPALAGAAAAGSTVSTCLTLLHVMTTKQLKTAIAALVLLGAVAGLFSTRHTNQVLRDKVESLQIEGAQLERVQENNRRLSRLEMDYAELERLRGQNRELFRLRGEVSQLRQQLVQAENASNARRNEATTPSVSREQQQEILKTLGMAKMTLVKVWGQAFLDYAKANNGKMPENFKQAVDYFYPVLRTISKEEHSLMNLASLGDFDIVFHGSLTDIQVPDHTILLREKHPFDYRDDGTASRTYLFADGHSAVARAANADFADWERMATSVDDTESQ